MPVWRTLLASCLALCTLVASIAHAETVLAALDWPRPTPPRPERELDCLALNIYWEARSEPLLGRVAVAAVTLNRVAAPAFPDSVCEVVFQGEQLGRHMCQFSWRCDGRADRPRNPVAWEEARRVARLALVHGVDDPTGGALWYHADHVLPSWAGEMVLQARIGHHLFYGLEPDVGTLAALDQIKEAGNAAAMIVPPSPMKPVLAAWPTTADAGAGISIAELKIDFGPDPAKGLLLCDVETVCGKLEPYLEPLHEASTLLPFFDTEGLLGAEAGGSSQVSDASHTPPEAGVEPVS